MHLQRKSGRASAIPEPRGNHPALRNMLLAARAFDLGARLTTLYLQFEQQAEAALGLTAGVHSYALLPIGYPLGRFGPCRARSAFARENLKSHCSWPRGTPMPRQLRGGYASVSTLYGST